MSIMGETNELIYDMMHLFAKKLKKKPKLRKWMLIGSIVTTAILFIILYINEVKLKNDNNISLLIILIVLLLSSAGILYTSMLSYLISDSKSTVSERLEELAEERVRLNDKLQNNTNVMDVIKINLNQLDEYYTINKGQARKSYSFSVWMITVGFIVLIAGIILWYNGKLDVNITIIASLAGLIAEFIGATSLFLYKENSKQAQAFVDKLSYLQHIMLAVELSEKLKDDKKEEEIALIISALIKKETNKK